MTPLVPFAERQIIKMNGFPSKEVVERLRQQYSKGTRVELISMDDPHTRLKCGDRGTVVKVDDIGTIFVAWDCGSSLGVAYGVDHVRILNDR